MLCKGLTTAIPGKRTFSSQRKLFESSKELKINLKPSVTVRVMTKQGALGGDLVFELVIESKLVLWFPIWHFVPPEPVDRGLQITGFQAPDITDV